MRGQELEFLNLYEFIAIIAIIPLPKDKTQIKEKSEDKQNDKHAYSRITTTTGRRKHQ